MATEISYGDANAGFQAAIINGPVNTSFHLPPKQPESPSRPSIVIPFSRDVEFVERGTILDQIHRICAVPGSRAALVGLGGVGKSQLAIEHAYRTRERSPETWVFWVHASNADRFEQGFREIANCVKILGRDDKEANTFKLVHDWLRCSKEQWLLVLDNVDDARFLLDVHGNSGSQAADSRTARRPLREYLPYCERGSILVTTRNKEAAWKLVEHRDIVEVEPMNEAEALELFKMKLGAQGHDYHVAELAVALEYMPLAIAQAAAYIVQRTPRCSVAKYLDDFKKSERKRTSLLNRDDGQLRRDLEAKNSIIVTWQLSFECIKQTRPSAADLLSLMSFFDRQGIPEALLRHRAEPEKMRTNQEEQDDDNKIVDDDDDASQRSAGMEEFEDDVLALRNFCFISADPNGAAFEMHALVQLATRKWLEANGQLECWKEQFITILCAAFPNGMYENWPTCRTLFAHAKSAAAQQPRGDASLIEWASLLYRAAWYAKNTQNGMHIEKLALQSMKTRIKLLGREHEDTLRSMSLVGIIYYEACLWHQAAEIRLEVYKVSMMKLGSDHPITVASMDSLASSYFSLGQLEDAEELQVPVVETRKTYLGTDHSDTLMSMNNLALTYWYQGRSEEAERLQIFVMETCKTKLGADHPSTLTGMSNLACTWERQGRGAEAKCLLNESVQLYQRILGPNHPDTRSSVAELARWEKKIADAESVSALEQLEIASDQ